MGRHQNQVFFPHYDYAGQIDALRNIPEYSNNAKSELEDYLLCAVPTGRWLFHICFCGTGLCFSKDCHDVFDLDDEQAIITFEIDGYGAFGIEQHFVVLTQRYVQ